MDECDNCGAEVTDLFVRVFGVDGVLDGCVSCRRRFSGDTDRFSPTPRR